MAATRQQMRQSGGFLLYCGEVSFIRSITVD